MRLVVKKWIPQYGVVVVKNRKICFSVDSCFNTEKGVLTSKRNWLVLFLEWNLLSRLSYTRIIVLTRTTRRRICDFATFRFGTLPVPLTPINGPASFAIGGRPEITLRKRLSLRFGGDISVRSVIYPMGRPFCFRGSVNNNVLLSLLLTVNT